MSIYNKIVFNGQTLIDLSNDTVDSSDDIVEGLVGHLNNGTSVTGTASGGGGGGSATDPVRFIDYDGTILYSYSAEDFANLTAMPANPTHTGLTSQGWNWSLADAKAQVSDTGSCDIGQMYTTNDGKTRIHISLDSSLKLSPYLGIGLNGTAIIDWGDNSLTDTITGTSVATIYHTQHIYATTGDYVIIIEVVSGSIAITGYSTSNGSSLLTETNGNSSGQKYYQNSIKKIELGENVIINPYAFYYCYSLESVTIPSGVTAINNYAFYYCISLKSITIPSGVTMIGQYICAYCGSLLCASLPKGISQFGGYNFQHCNKLKRVTIPYDITSLGNNMFHNCYTLKNIMLPSGFTRTSLYAFQNCYSFTSFIIPSGVTSIGNYTFSGCSSMVEYHLLPTIPPTLSNTNAFNSIPSYCKIYVPAESLTAYQEATNWSTYASYMVGE